MYELINWLMDVWMNEWMYVWINEWMNGCMNEWMNVCMNDRMHRFLWMHKKLTIKWINIEMNY